MLCEKCQLLSQTPDVARGHADLKHINVRFYKSTVPLVDARTDEYQCAACDARWERDFDPAATPSYSAFRRVG